MNSIGFWDNPFDPHHDMNIETLAHFSIPLQTKGTKIYFKSRVPTESELNNCHHISMTSKREWKPRKVRLSSIESTRSTNYSCIMSQFATIHLPSCTRIISKTLYENPTSDASLLHDINPCLTSLYELLISNITTDIQHDVPARKTFVSHDRHNKLTAETISDLWCIGLKRAKATLNTTTHRSTRSAILPLYRRYRAERRYNLKRLNKKFATDTFYGDIKSLNQNIGAQIFSHKIGFNVCYPLKSTTGNELGDCLQHFVHDFGVPNKLKSDGHPSQAGYNTHFQTIIRKYNINHSMSEPYRAPQNPAEPAIQDVKMRWYRIMFRKRVP